MERDWDLVQSILEKAEENDPFSDEGISVKGLTSDYGPEVVAYHVILLTKENFLRPESTSDLREYYLEARPAVENGSGKVDHERQGEGQMRLTWKGHNLLDILRDHNEPKRRDLLTQILKL